MALRRLPWPFSDARSSWAMSYFGRCSICGLRCSPLAIDCWWPNFCPWQQVRPRSHFKVAPQIGRESLNPLRPAGGSSAPKRPPSTPAPHSLRFAGSRASTFNPGGKFSAPKPQEVLNGRVVSRRGQVCPWCVSSRRTPNACLTAIAHQRSVIRHTKTPGESSQHLPHNEQAPQPTAGFLAVARMNSQIHFETLEQWNGANLPSWPIHRPSPDSNARNWTLVVRRPSRLRQRKGFSLPVGSLSALLSTASTT